MKNLTYKLILLLFLAFGKAYGFIKLQAVMAADFIQCNQIIGCHCNTFPPIEIEVSKAQELFEA